MTDVPDKRAAKPTKQQAERELLAELSKHLQTPTPEASPEPAERTQPSQAAPTEQEPFQITKGELTCITCLRTFSEEGWDPMGGDCPIVQDSTGKVITSDGDFASLGEFKAAWTEY